MCNTGAPDMLLLPLREPGCLRLWSCRGRQVDSGGSSSSDSIDSCSSNIPDSRENWASFSGEIKMRRRRWSSALEPQSAQPAQRSTTHTLCRLNPPKMGWFWAGGRQLNTAQRTEVLLHQHCFESSFLVLKDEKEKSPQELQQDHYQIHLLSGAPQVCTGRSVTEREREEARI